MLQKILLTLNVQYQIRIQNEIAPLSLKKCALIKTLQNNHPYLTIFCDAALQKGHQTPDMC